MPFSNGVRVEHVLLLGVFLFVRHAFGKSAPASNVSDEGEDGEHEEHEEGFVVSMNSCTFLQSRIANYLFKMST